MGSAVVFAMSLQLIKKRKKMDLFIPEVVKTGSANLIFLCNFSQLPLSNITLFTVLFTADVVFFVLFSG